MSNVQLYRQVAAEVSPSLRPVVPEPQDGPSVGSFEEDGASELFGEASGTPAAEAFIMPMVQQSLRRTGSRPERFVGRHLAMASGWNNAVSRWYEFNLYQSEAGEIVCDIRLFHKSSDNADLYRVSRHSDWRSAVTWLESYNTARDLVCDVSVDDESLSAAEISLRGITIRQWMLELKTQYQTTLGNLLYELKPDLDG